MNPSYRLLRTSAIAALNAAGNPSAAFDTDCLFEHCFSLTHAQLLAHASEPASEEGAARFRLLLARRVAGEPLQYLLGRWEFYGLPFFVGPGVLIPRADSEMLVEMAVVRLKLVETPKIADLCAGTGCLAIALARCRPDASVLAVEYEPAAMAYLTRNIALHSAVSVHPLEADVLAPPPPGLGPLDALVSNPPYIRRDEMPALSREVQHEPYSALYGGEDGLDFYRTIAAYWVPLLKPGMFAAVEVGAGQADTVCGIFSDAGMYRIHTARDIQGIERVVYGRRPREYAPHVQAHIYG